MELKDVLFNAKFYRDYDRRKQMERLNDHLKEGDSISSFLCKNGGVEQTIDTLIITLAQTHLALLEATKTTPKKPWQFWK